MLMCGNNIRRLRKTQSENNILRPSIEQAVQEWLLTNDPGSRVSCLSHEVPVVCAGINASLMKREAKKSENLKIKDHSKSENYESPKTSFSFSSARRAAAAATRWRVSSAKRRSWISNNRRSSSASSAHSRSFSAILARRSSARRTASARSQARASATSSARCAARSSSKSSA